MNIGRDSVASAAAPTLGPADFARLAEPLLSGLRLHCYRLTGSLDDADDMVQETMARGWLHRDRLVDESGLRIWLYRIATNACLDFVNRRRTRRTVSLDSEAAWPEPVPEGWAGREPAGGDPADLAIRRETIHLAFVTAVQRLPPRQRAMLVLRDVLGWSARDVAEALGTSPAAVHSGVRRARTAAQVAAPTEAVPRDDEGDSEATEVARRYLEAWERADVDGLARLLTTDARMAMPPDPRCFVGRESIVEFLAGLLSEPQERRIRLAPTTANGGPAFIVQAPDPDAAAIRRIDIKAILLRGGRIAEIRGYMDARLASRFKPG